jgi:valyl-tRNA synthetase
MKPRLSDPGHQDHLVPMLVLHAALSTGLKLAHPLMPFITEELFQRLAAKTSTKLSSIMIQSYPQPDQVNKIKGGGGGAMPLHMHT